MSSIKVDHMKAEYMIFYLVQQIIALEIDSVLALLQNHNHDQSIYHCDDTLGKRTIVLLWSLSNNLKRVSMKFVSSELLTLLIQYMFLHIHSDMSARYISSSASVRKIYLLALVQCSFFLSTADKLYRYSGWAVS